MVCVFESAPTALQSAPARRGSAQAPTFLLRRHRARRARPSRHRRSCSRATRVPGSRPRRRHRPCVRLPRARLKLCSSSSLSARSRMSCSAFFRPTRGTLCSVATSFSRIARTSRSAVSDDSSPSASAGPTPFAPSTCWKTRRSNVVVKPNSCQPSSFTTRYVCSEHRSPVLRERLVYAQRHRELVGDAAGGQDLDRGPAPWRPAFRRPVRSWTARAWRGCETRRGELRTRWLAHASTAVEARQVAPITQASAAATPSAASDGCGALRGAAAAST